MKIPLLLLALGSFWFLLGINPFSTASWIVNDLQPGDGFPDTAIALTAAAIVLVALTAAYFYFRNRTIAGSPAPWKTIDIRYEKIIVVPFLKLSSMTAHAGEKWIDGFIQCVTYAPVIIAHLAAWTDRNIVDGIANGCGHLVRLIGNVTRSAGGGKIQSYILWATIVIIIFIASILFL